MYTKKSSIPKWFFRFQIVAFFVLGFVQALAANEQSKDEYSSRYKTGYENIAQFGGPTSVTAELKKADEIREGMLRFPNVDKALEPWFDLKKQIKKRYGLVYNIDYQTLYQ